MYQYVFIDFVGSFGKVVIGIHSVTLGVVVFTPGNGSDILSENKMVSFPARVLNMQFI